MKKQILPFVIGIVAVLLFLEIIFRVLPVSTATRSGYYIHPLILTYPGHHCFTVATGWDLKNVQHNCANNLGFLADRDFVLDPLAIALIGDSFVEANMLPVQHRLAARLQIRIPDRPVYALSGPGSSLLDYAERAKFAANRLGVKTFVFILSRIDIQEAICGSGSIHGTCLDPQTHMLRTETQPEASILKRVLRESALAQYVFSQLKLDISNILPKVKSEGRGGGKVMQKLPSLVSEQVVSLFFRQVSTIENARFIFLIDPDRAHLFDSVTTESNDLQSLRSAAYANGSVVIDPTTPFREFVAGSARKLEVGPYDRHWNWEAIEILSGLIANELMEEGVK